jgi:hypothetical protein
VPAADEAEACWLVSDLDGRILQAGGVLALLNLSERALIGRDVFVFIDKERQSFHRSMLALSPNVTIERDFMLRPRDRKPFLARAIITRQPNDATFWWSFSRLTPTEPPSPAR